jgi:hypothetical protein
VHYECDLSIQFGMIDEAFQVLQAALEAVRVHALVRFVRKPTADMVGHDDPVSVSEREHQMAVVIRPGGVAMHHEHGRACALVQIVHADAVEVQEATFERVVLKQRLHAYHSTPIIMQFNPLPIPRNATRSPCTIASRSAASAAVSGSDTVPILPK